MLSAVTCSCESVARRVAMSDRKTARRRSRIRRLLSIRRVTTTAERGQVNVAITIATPRIDAESILYHLVFLDPTLPPARRKITFCSAGQSHPSIDAERL